MLEGKTAGGWKELAAGTSVGHKKIDRLAPAKISALRLRVTEASAEPLIRRLAVFSGPTPTR